MIPFYRARVTRKRWGSLIEVGDYVQGYLFQEAIDSHDKDSFDYVYFIKQVYGDHFQDFEIDITTLSIHFPDILDSQGNKIFASLQESGRGGDILEFSSEYFGDYSTVLYFENHRLITHSKMMKENTIRNKEFLSSAEVIGIQE